VRAQASSTCDCSCSSRRTRPSASSSMKCAHCRCGSPSSCTQRTWAATHYRAVCDTRWDGSCRCRSCTGTGPIPARICTCTGLTLPHRHRDWAHPCHICARTWLTPPTSASGLGPTATVSASGLFAHAQDGVARYASDEYTNAVDSLGQLSMHLTNDDVNHVKGKPGAAVPTQPVAVVPSIAGRCNAASPARSIAAEPPRGSGRRA
jgi:hypothetical protein